MKQGDFTQLAQHYHHRPAYSQMLLEKLVACINDAHLPLEQLQVVEVGAGSGKLTKMLDSMGLKVIAIEPNDNMRNAGIAYTQGSAITWQKGSGEDTHLPSHIADWVVMASSFHWTNPAQSLPEFARILKDSQSSYKQSHKHTSDTLRNVSGGGGAYFTALWNPRHIIKGSIFYEIEEAIKHIVPELTRVSSGAQNAKAWDEILCSSGDFTDCFFMECDHKEIMDKSRYLGAWHSANDIQAQAGEKRWQEILKMIESTIADLSIIEVPYKIRAWSVRKA